MTTGTFKDDAAAFAELQPRLGDLWNRIFPDDDEAYTSVIVPSLTLDPDQMFKIDGISHYEERLLFLIMRLRNPRARVIYVTSQPVHPLVLEYYLHLLVGVPATHARARLTMLCAYDSSSRSLTEKILERPRLIERIRAAIGDPMSAYLTVFNSTVLELRLAVALGIPMNAADPAHSHLGTKSGSRKLFRECGIQMPFGFEDLYSSDEIIRALVEIRRARPEVRRAVLKLNESISGEGNAIFTFPPSSETIAQHLPFIRFTAPSETAASYLEKFARSGGIAEEMLEGAGSTSPSVQVRINPQGVVIPTSTHEQILGGKESQIFLGCRFPAEDAYRADIQEVGQIVGRALAEKGVIGRFSVDFIARQKSDAWEAFALEINLRMGGATHPLLALRFLTGGSLDKATGLFHTPDGTLKYYRASDNVQSSRYRGLLPEDLIDILVMNKLDFSHRTGTGVLFHIIGAISQYGKVGVTAIGDSRDEAERLFERTIRVLDAETGDIHEHRDDQSRGRSVASQKKTAHDGGAGQTHMPDRAEEPHSVPRVRPV